MSRFNTGNPLGSGDPRDLDDNAKNMDLAVNSDELSWDDRFGRERKSFEGMEREFSADQSRRESEFDADQAARENEFDSAQNSREVRFNNFIASSGYQFAGDYGPGIEITEYNQLIRDSSGEFWRVSGQVELPYTTTGAGIPEDDALVPAGDAVLRQDLSSPDKGAAMVARAPICVDSIADLLALPGGQRKEGVQYLVKSYHGGWAIEVPYVGPKGGGEFFWDSTKAADYDGGIYFNGFVRVLKGFVTPYDYGCRGDRISLDTQRFQATLDNGLVDVEVDRGEFLVANLVMPQNLQVTFRKGGVLVLSENANCIEMAKNSHLIDAQIDCSEVSMFTHSAIYFDAGALANAATRNHSTRVIRPWLWGREGPLGQMGSGIHVHAGDAPDKMYFMYATDLYINAFEKGIRYTSDGGYLNSHSYTNLFFSGCIWDVWLEGGGNHTFTNMHTQPDAWRGKQGVICLDGSNNNLFDDVFVWDASAFAPDRNPGIITMTETAAGNTIRMRTLTDRSVLDKGTNNSVEFIRSTSSRGNSTVDIERVRNLDMYSNNALMYADLEGGAIVQTGGVATIQTGALTNLLRPLERGNNRVARWGDISAQPIVVEVTPASVVNNVIAVCVNQSARPAGSVKIEAYRAGAWEVWDDFTGNAPTVIVSRSLAYTPYSNGVEKIRVTLSDPGASGTIELSDICVLTNAPDNHFLSRSGGEMHGRVTFNDRVFIKERLCVTDQQPATTAGSVVARMPIYNEAGGFIGHIPIYNVVE